jgi:serine/threonine protein kinase
MINGPKPVEPRSVISVRVFTCASRTTTPLEDRLHAIRAGLLPIINDLRLCKEASYQPFEGSPIKISVDGQNFSFGLKIGQGGMGGIFLGCNLATNELVVLKMIRSEMEGIDELRDRFRGEANFGRELGSQHPGIVCTLHYSDGLRPFMILPYLSGATLEELLNAEEVLPLPQALMILYYLCEVESFLLDRYIIHRDMKMGNVMLIDTTDEPSRFPLVVFDLGVAKNVRTPSRTVPGSVMGSPTTIAPEVMSGRAGASVLGEQFALGMMLTEMLIGQLPGKEHTTLVDFLLDRELTPEQEAMVPVAALPLVQKLLNKNANERFPDMRALQAEVARLLML